MPVKLTENEAKQGRRSNRTLVILLVSLALAALVWWSIEVVYRPANAPAEITVPKG